MTIEEKHNAVEILQRRLPPLIQQLEDVDERLVQYFTELAENPDWHNGYEILCGVRFLRYIRTYGFNIKRVRQIIKLREGNWECVNGKWRHISGGIRQPLTQGDMVLRWEPFQIAIIAYIFGPMAWIDTGLSVEDRQELLATERKNESNGQIEDLRRLCTNFTLFGPRKIDKTGISAYVAQVFFLLEDVNAEIYCTSNSADQSKILFRRIKHGIAQLDPEGKKIRQTETVCDWRPSYRGVRDSCIRPLSAGGKTKDGMFAQLCCADEYGSAGYTNGKCDMKRLVDVTESSMGPRREPLTIITTTAGRIDTGPFIEKLDSLHRLLIEELKYETGESIPELSLDRVCCILFEPDDWEKQDQELILTSKQIRKKINPMVGKIVQYSFYDDEVAKAKMSGDLGEVMSKLFNVYDSARITSWLSGDKVRPLQKKMCVTDCKYMEGWQTFVGLDFSSGDDLFAITYLSVNYKTKNPVGRFHADMEAWIVESTLKTSPNRPLYEKWIELGYLKVCPGDVFDPNLPIMSLIEKNNHGVNICYFGYDPAQSKLPINSIKAWLQTLGIQAKMIQQMVVAVPQSFIAFNGIVGEIEYYILNGEPWLSFSDNPMWPWQFGNCRVEEVHELRKLLKASPTAKVDNVHALVDAFYCFDLSEGRVQN